MSLNRRLLMVAWKAELSCDGLLSWAVSRCRMLSSDVAARRGQASSAALPEPQETRPTGCPLPGTAEWSGQGRLCSPHHSPAQHQHQALDRLGRGCCPSITAQGCAQSQARGCVCHCPNAATLQPCARLCQELSSCPTPCSLPPAARTHSEGSAVGCH